jgi:hypothetical protein
MTTATLSSRSGRTTMRALLICAMAVATLALAAVAKPTSAAAVEWRGEFAAAPSNFQPGDKAMLRFTIGNADGDEAGWPTATVELPSGLTMDEFNSSEGFGWSCTAAGDPQVVSCEFPFGPFFPPQRPYSYIGGVFQNALALEFTVNVDAGVEEGLYPVELTVEGGGAGGPISETYQIRVGGPQLGFGPVPESVVAGAFDAAGTPYTQAGGHPADGTASFSLATKLQDPADKPASDFRRWVEAIAPVGTPKDIVTELPPGFVGNPAAAPMCSGTEVLEAYECPTASQVGVADVKQLGLPHTRLYGVYNMEPDGDAPAMLAFQSPVGPVLLTPILRSDGDWGLSLKVRNITEANPIFSTAVTLWGVPGDPSHDELRCANPNYLAQACVGRDMYGETWPNKSADQQDLILERKPFISNPTRCTGAPETTRIHFSSWQDPGTFQPDGDPDLSSGGWVTSAPQAPPLTDCEMLSFKPSLKARPTAGAADSPTGLEVDLHIPQNADPDGLATAHLRKAVVQLPEGLVVNPSGANGLGACSPAQIGMASAVGAGDPAFDRTTDACPDSAKIGTVEVATPLLEAPLKGSVYLATPHQNPFGSLLAMYITVRGPGVFGKLAGEVTPDPQTGRLTAVVDDNPQVPFEDLHLDFFGGQSAPLRTPATCGTFAVTSQLTPWSAPQSGPAATPADSWGITRGPDGVPCAGSEGQLPHSPSFEAGTTNPVAGAHSPFVIELRRADGTQQFGSVTVTPPKGLLAKLAGTTYCPDASLAAAAGKDGEIERATPSCPASSEVGNVVAAAGAGPAPYHAPGKAYLAGPYKGAPMSLAIVTPAVAGPFDLGTIVVRSALHVDPVTTQITAISDSIPRILEGIPLDVRAVSIRLDRPQFTLNPTSCAESSIGATLFSTSGQAASLLNRFQVGDCAALAFKPKLAMRFSGPTHRSAHPKLRAVLTMPDGGANIRKAVVTLPETEFLENDHIRTVCTRVQYAAGRCPKASVYGYAKAWSPLLDRPLQGPVYLRSSDDTLPNLVASLDGQIHVDLAGRIDSVNERIRNTFWAVPDAPVSKFVLTMQGGKKGLLANNTELCKVKPRVKANFTGHNGKVKRTSTRVKVSCGKGGKKRK